MKERTRSIITAGVVLSSFAILSVLERRRPLRRRVEPVAPRLRRNLTLGAISFAAAQIIERVLPAPRSTGRFHDVASIVLLDYTLWWWHRMNHQWPPLWRFHSVHHADRDMDASTAFRFHVAEHALSHAYRAMQMVVIRPSARAMWLWQLILFVSILFHHSNLRLPEQVDDALVPLIVTPRMHGIHHSERPELTNANFASILTCWDALHGTLRTDVPQDSLVIGLKS
jgi:hypothetical protein